MEIEKEIEIEIDFEELEIKKKVVTNKESNFVFAQSTNLDNFFKMKMTRNLKILKIVQ